MGEPTLRDVVDRLDRLERMLSILVAALSEEGGEQDDVALTLDGQPAGRPRKAGDPL